jgi:hypothetical protein
MGEGEEDTNVSCLIHCSESSTEFSRTDHTITIVNHKLYRRKDV